MVHLPPNPYNLKTRIMNSRLQYFLGSAYAGLVRLVNLSPLFLPALVGLGVIIYVPFLSSALRSLFSSVFLLTPLWLPFVLFIMFFRLWTAHNRLIFIKSQEMVLLEIRVPKDVSKSPLAMEIVLGALQQTVGESTWYDRTFLGKVRANFTLEIVSIEGSVKFFIHTRRAIQKFIESQIYSQYPSAEIHETEDYIKNVPYAKNDSNWALFGAEFGLTKPDPYPIKTYIDYGTDKDVFEEKKVDPITPLLEFMGAIGKGEQIWFQILVRANKGAKDPTSYWINDWQKEGKELVDKIVEDSKKRLQAPEDSEIPAFAYISEGDRTAMKAIERSIGKLGFDCGIRAIYIAKKDVFNSANIAGLFGTIKQYNSNDLNGFKPTLYTDFDYPWQDYKNYRLSILKWKMFDSYRRRSWFFPPYERKPFVLNSEELATIYHFPGRVAETPTFERIESKKAEPPAGLPT